MIDYDVLEMKRAAQCCRERLAKAARMPKFRKALRLGWFPAWNARVEACGADLDRLKEAALRIRCRC